MSAYDAKFFAGIAAGSYRAATVLLPEIRTHYAFTSVCDVGCGSGTWLRAAGEWIGTGARLTRVDGEHARTTVNCPGATFVFQNLESLIAGVARHDLAMSLEVAERLSAARAPGLVDDLCAISDVVLFGGAVAHQGGTSHLNDQPQSYWLAHFKRNGYVAYDIHRAALWNHPAFVDCAYYVGNTLLYVRDGHALADELVRFRLGEGDLIDVVHPGLLKTRAEPGFRVSLLEVLAALKRALARRLHPESKP